MPIIEKVTQNSVCTFHYKMVFIFPSHEISVSLETWLIRLPACRLMNIRVNMNLHIWEYFAHNKNKNLYAPEPLAHESLERLSTVTCCNIFSILLKTFRAESMLLGVFRKLEDYRI